MIKLLLASSSQTRKEILSRTGIAFEAISPDIDETYKDQNPEDYVHRLAREKSQAGWKLFQSKEDEVSKNISYIIGADQVAVFKNKIYGKPRTFDEAKKMLQIFSNNEVTWLSALAILRADNGQIVSKISKSKALFEKLDDNIIERYLSVDKPFTAGAIKIESMGTTLIKSFNCDDPTGIMGLPLVSLNNLLQEFGTSLLQIHDDL